MRLKAVLLVCLTALLFTHLAFAQDDDEMLVEYPDGSYGLDLGEEYEVLPDGDFIGGPAERGEYEDTDYGPTTRRGLEVFPDFRWSRGRKAKALEEEVPGRYYIYYEATTTSAEIPEQKPLKEENVIDEYIGTGVSGAGEYKKPVKKEENAVDEYIGTGVSEAGEYKKPEPEVTD
ncbi:MAG: hypothetical protein WBB86_06315 [Candidatus Omnitrophota bacterium]